MTHLVYAVMCGGSGTRLWPWSRRSFPKQFLPLGGNRSLLQNTVQRLEGLAADVSVLAVGNEQHRFLIAEHLNATGARIDEIVLEPEGRNTACVAIISALRAAERWGSDSLVLLAAADHYIDNPDAYRTAVSDAIQIAQQGRVVTFGIRPTRPEIGYGYIEIGEELPGTRGFAIRSFREKPDQATAESYVAADNFFWNSGIFLFTAGHLLDLAAELQPAMLAACRETVAVAKVDMQFLHLASEPFRKIQDISFDYAVMETIGNRGAVIPIDIGWSDIGSWSALRNLYENDAAGNVTYGAAEVFDCERVMALSDGPLVVAHGLRDAIVVVSNDAVYVATPDASQRVKDVVAKLEKQKRREAVTHTREYRPWGWYKTINMGERFQVKEIFVKPGGRLSLQSHNHRAEHWVIVRGTAKVTIGDETKLISENQSVYIPLGVRHRLENSGRIPMHLIEVQTGSYLEEDDIQRYDDVYGRN